MIFYILVFIIGSHFFIFILLYRVVIDNNACAYSISGAIGTGAMGAEVVVVVPSIICNCC